MLIKELDYCTDVSQTGHNKSVQLFHVTQMLQVTRERVVGMLIVRKNNSFAFIFLLSLKQQQCRTQSWLFVHLNSGADLGFFFF